MSKNPSVYNKAVEITEEYLGPAGERFLRRQITTHLNKDPEKINKKDLSKLVDWSSLAFALLTNNSEDVEAFTKELSTLTDGDH
jgi:hypothetical protein